MSKKRLVLEFDDATTRDDFVGWFLDGGGEYQFNEGREERDEPRLATESRDPEKWDWQIDPDADEHVILMSPYPEDEDDA
jgi:hypothetical protein